MLEEEEKIAQIKAFEAVLEEYVSANEAGYITEDLANKLRQVAYCKKFDSDLNDVLDGSPADETS